MDSETEELVKKLTLAPPDEDLYEEREVPGKGIGVFSRLHIPSGSRLLAESPMFVLPDDASILELHRAVECLPGQDQERFWSLAASCKYRKSREWISGLRLNREDPIALQALIQGHLKGESIYQTNRFTVRSLDNSSDRAGIFPKAARFNHACTPNAFHRYSTAIGCITIHALRDIKPGEEILTSYIDTCHSTAERRRILHHWGFVCQCDTCNKEDFSQDWRRGKLEKLLEKLKKVELNRADESWEPWDYARALTLVEEIMQLMEEECMFESDTLGEIYARAAEYAGAIGALRVQAIEWARKAAAVELKCCGRDSSEYNKAMVLVHSFGEVPLDRQR